MLQTCVVDLRGATVGGDRAGARRAQPADVKRPIATRSAPAPVDMKTAPGQHAEDDEIDVDARAIPGQAVRSDPLGAALARAVREQGGRVLSRQGTAVAGSCPDVEPRPHPALLQKGSQQSAVREAQRKLNIAKSGDPSTPLVPDCIFGPLTDAAVRAFQKAEFADPKEHDGKIGAKTWAKLDGVSPGPAPPVPPPVPPTPPVALTVTVPANVRGSSSPASMKDRIPPRKDTDVQVDIAGHKAGDPPVILSIDGAGAGNGTATIDGANTKSLKASAKVKLRGKVQTDPGKGGALKLVARQGGSQVATSAGFSVSAIPQNYTDTFVRLVTGPARGFVVQDGWESDSGRFKDLDQTEISEQVEVTLATGCFTGLGKKNSGYLPGNVLTQDTHSSPVAPMTSVGQRIAQQTCMFKDKRSGSDDIPMTKSGYELIRNVTARPKGGFNFQLTKKGKATTANSIASAAGKGNVDKTQKV